MEEGTLHKWFSGSKDKSGKPGWVNVVTGDSCASDKPGEGVHFYIPTARAFEFGGYEVNSHRNYLKPSGPTKEWESAVVKNAVDLVRRMLGKQSYV